MDAYNLSIVLDLSTTGYTSGVHELSIQASFNCTTIAMETYVASQ